MSPPTMTPLRIGITCYPTFGGSGIIATEIGLAMAERGHQVHFICTAVPERVRPHPNVRVHPVAARDYPVFPTVPYSLALCSKMVEVANTHGLDLLHPHYAVPHATSAWMAKEVLGGHIQVVTTLHGTDITLIGSDATYLPITRHSIARSDAVTAPSAFLRDETWSQLGLCPNANPIEVIANFVDTERFQPGPSEVRALFDEDLPVVVHVSNFRPLKRVDRVLETFIAADVPANLLLIGEGPELPRIQALAAPLGRRVRFLGATAVFEHLLRGCDVFLLASETESFGLAALEALSSGVPVIAPDVGGLAEVVAHERTGFLEADVEGMAGRLRQLLTDAVQRRHLGSAAREDVLARFQQAPVIDRYEALYRRVVAPR